MLETCYSVLGQATCDTLAGALLLIGLIAALIVIVAIALLLLAARQIRDLDIPADADFFETMRLIPITIPIALDLLDLVFDFLSFPLTWVILESLGLKALQFVTVAEGIIPGTQAIPTMTGAWILARLTRPSEPVGEGATLRDPHQELAERMARRRSRRGDYRHDTDEPAG